MEETAKMNVLIIMLDSLRPDFLGCGGDNIIKTPHIDKIAAEGIFFDQAYAEYPITIPSRTALVSGNYTFTNRRWRPLCAYDLHIAELLKKEGYTTAAFSDSPFNRAMGMSRGFNTFVQVAGGGKCHPPVTDKKYKFPEAYFPPGCNEEKHIYSNTMISRFYAREQYDGKSCPEVLFEQSMEWLEKNQKKPFLLWIDSFEPHEPWCPSPPYDSLYPGAKNYNRYIPLPAGPSSDWMTPEDIEHVLALYRGDITHTDEQVGRVMSKLKKLGLEKDTLVIIISDHGEPFGEHGTIRKYGVPVYEELARMVFIVRKPGLIPPGSRSSTLVGNIDLTPTILDLLNIEPPERPDKSNLMGHELGEKLDGESLTPVFRNEKIQIREAFYCGAFGLRASVRQGEWKFIDHRGEKPNELFNLSEDPKEKINLLEKNKKLAAGLHRRLWEFQARWSASLSWRDRPAVAEE